MERLRSHRDFVAVLKHRNKVTSRDLVVHYYACSGNAQAAGSASRGRRLGLAVSKNVGNAVMRNHVKRRFRQLAKEYESQLPEQCDIVIRAKPRAGKASFAMLQTQVQRLFTEIGTRAQREQCAPAAGDNHARGFVQ